MIAMWLRTLIAFFLRLFLRTPLILVAHLMWAISAFLDQIGDGFDKAQLNLKQITSAPFIFGWRKQIAELDEAQKRRILKRLDGELDT